MQSRLKEKRHPATNHLRGTPCVVVSGGEWIYSAAEKRMAFRSLMEAKAKRAGPPKLDVSNSPKKDTMVMNEMARLSAAYVTL